MPVLQTSRLNPKRPAAYLPLRLLPAGTALAPTAVRCQCIKPSYCCKRSRSCTVGGHEGVFKANGPVLEKKVGARERDFYTAAAAGQWPAAFLPAFHGAAAGDDGRIGLENLLHGMRCPCVIDLKMGTRSVEASEHNLLKKAKMSALDLVTGTAFTGAPPRRLQPLLPVYNCLVLTD